MRSARSRPLLARSALLSACSCALAFACGFPDINFGSSDGGPDSPNVAADAGVADTGTAKGDASGPDTSTLDGTVTDASSADATADVEAPDAARSADASAAADVAATDSAAADGPGLDAGGVGDSSTDGPPDTNLDASADAGGVVNCDCGTLSLYPTGVPPTCGFLGTGLICTQSGFVHQPACGESDDFITCTFGITCTGTHSTKIQECH